MTDVLFLFPLLQLVTGVCPLNEWLRKMWLELYGGLQPCAGGVRGREPPRIASSGSALLPTTGILLLLLFLFLNGFFKLQF